MQIKYYNKFTSSISEINNSPTLLIHSVSGCNLKCYNCLNYDSLIKNKHDNFYTINDITNYLKLNSFIYDYIVLSGGEFLINDLDLIIKDVTQIKQSSHIPIIIYTNGTFPLKLRYLLEKEIIDGVHTDMKLPFQYIDYIKDQELLFLTLGSKASQQTISDIILSFEYTVQFDKGLNQIRSVKYPFLDPSVFNDNKQWIEKLNLKYHQHTPYIINEFIKKG